MLKRQYAERREMVKATRYMTARAVANLWNTTPSQVRNARRQYGIEPLQLRHANCLPIDQHNERIRLHNNGLDLYEISKRLKVSRNTLAMWYLRHGITPKGYRRLKK